MKDPTRMPIEEIRFDMQRFDPINRRHAGLKEKREHYIVSGMDSALNFAVLLIGVWT